MFNAISGILSGRSFDSILIDTHGIEWDICVPAITINDFGAVGSRTKAYIHLLHREDAMKLFGFPTEHERKHFFELIKVEGIGPKQAIKIMSGILPDALETAIETEDLAALERIPGVGKKTAQKIIFALKGRIVRHADNSPVSGPHDDVIRALIEMGFERKETEKAVNEANTALGSGLHDEKLVFRTALVSLSGGS